MKNREMIFNTENVRVLVVDDNEVNCMIAANILKKFNIEVEEADSGTMAVSMCSNNTYDMVLMDYLMPDISGVEATEIIRRMDKEKKIGAIVALTANISEEVTNLFLDAGAQAILEKPIEIDKLSVQLKKWLSEDKITDKNDGGEEITKAGQAVWTALETALEGISEFQWREAVSLMCQSAEGYVKILRVSCRNVKEQITCLQQADKPLTDLEIQICFHSLKGIFANIGAKQLAEEALLFEKAVKSGNKEYIEKNKQSYLSKTELFLEQLEAALSLYDELRESKLIGREEKTIEREEFLEKLELLKRYIQRFEYNDIISLLEELISASKEENKKNLQKAEESIQLFQYEEALEYLSMVNLSI